MYLGLVGRRICLERVRYVGRDVDRDRVTSSKAGLSWLAKTILGDICSLNATEVITRRTVKLAIVAFYHVLEMDLAFQAYWAPLIALESTLVEIPYRGPASSRRRIS